MRPLTVLIVILGAGAAGCDFLPSNQGKPLCREPANAPGEQPQGAALESTTPGLAAEASRLLASAAAYLWQAQGRDGGWHSQHYALLRSGQAYTPFLLHALQAVPESVLPRPSQRVDRALAFIRSRIDGQGVIGTQDPDLLEYPNYSTAYALMCLVDANDPQDGNLRDRMVAYLAAEQFTEDRGFSPEHAAYGGWGFGGEHLPGQTGHMDLAHTRRVLQALRQAAAWGHSVDPEVFIRAQRFLSFCQKHPQDGRPQPIAPGRSAVLPGSVYNGGFYFSPIVQAANKGRRQSVSGSDRLSAFRSYATATCDGLLCLQATGVASSDERLCAALNWLEQHEAWDRPEGIPTDHPEPWPQALKFYHFAVRCEVVGSCSAYRPQPQLARLVDGLAEIQRPDGSFVNAESGLMKEDDPLLATTLAVIALRHIVELESKDLYQD